MIEIIAEMDGVLSWHRLHEAAAKHLADGDELYVNCPPRAWQVLRGDAQLHPGSTQRWEWEGSGWIRSVGVRPAGFQHLLVRASSADADYIEMHATDGRGDSLRLIGWALP